MSMSRSPPVTNNNNNCYNKTNSKKQKYYEINLLLEPKEKRFTGKTETIVRTMAATASGGQT